MGDAEAAQLNGFSGSAGLNNCTYLLYCFHVLCNVFKRTQHLIESVWGAVYRDILDMHYIPSQELFSMRGNEYLVSGCKMTDWAT